MGVFFQSPFFKHFDPTKRDGPAPGSIINTLLLSILLAVGYIVLGKLVPGVAIQNENITSFAFLPAGIALFFTIIFGIRVWPGIFIGQFVLALWEGLPVSAVVAISLISSLEGIIGSILFWRWGVSRNLNDFRSVVRLFGLIALILQPFSVTGKILVLYAGARLASNELVDAWMYTWAGHIVGQFLLVTLLLSWTSPATRQNKWEMHRALIPIGAYILLLIVFVCGEWGKGEPIFRLIFFASFYLTLGILAVQSSLRTMALVNFLMAGAFLWMISNGTNFLIFVSVQNRLLGADILIMAGAVTSLLMSTIWDELMVSRERLRESNAAKERLFSVIGHDLNAPIANLKSSLELLFNGTISDDELHGFQFELLKGVNHVHQTLKNLMEWGSIQMNSLQPNFEEISLYAGMTEALQLLDRIAVEKKITIENLVPQNAMVYADRHQVQSVVRNLLSNALKFTSIGGRVILSAKSEKGFWHVSVQDNGIGMLPERVARLFNTQGKYASTPGTTNERGLGLGLQICADFIRANKGEISVESQLGQGTVFHFSLPSVTPKDQGLSAPF